MRQSIFYLKKLTSAEVGTTKAHVGGYIRLPNDFDYELFFQSQGTDINGVTEIIFNAYNLNKGIVEQNLRFAYFGNSNNERRIPNLAKLYKENNVEEGDVVRLESRINDGIAQIFIQFFKNSDIKTSASNIFYVSTNLEQSNESKIKEPLQQIFYGAPGTGKSWKIDKKTKGYAVVRTTFHPDSDYSTFIGAYKPVMEECDVKVTPIVTNNGVSLQPSGTYTERRIVYKFVKQAFLKAYLGAWEKYVDKIFRQVSVDAGNGEKWILKSVDDTRVDAQKESFMNKDKFAKQVKEYWDKKVDNVGNTEHWRATACKWYKDNFSDEEEHTADDCWNAIEQALNEGNTISATPVINQTYYIKKGENENIIFNNENQGAVRNKIEEIYNTISESDNSFSIQTSIARKLKEFSDDNFEEAWNELKKRVNDKIIAPQFLVIEEINRGNCAQIFGDIFQLLDRSDSGFSTYPIEADTDLRDEIARAFTEEYKLSKDMNIEGAVKGYTSNYGATLSEDVQEGRVLLLPPNLYIWATMNTSDQSLFPIDSAFKRRWDWVYIPIKNHEEEGYKIDIDGAIYSWWGFLEKINKVIGKVTSSEDKKLGYFFVKAPDKVVDANKFVGKVLFYLWNDVFKNYGFDNTIFSRAENKKFEFSDFFDKKGEPETTVVNEFLEKLNETVDKDNSFIIKKSNDTVSSEEESSDTEIEQQEG